MRRILVCLSAAAACGGDPSPEAVCDHMMAVARKTGVPIAAEGDPKARCVEKQNRMKDKIGGEAWGKVATCILGKSDIAAMMNDCDPDRAPAKPGELGGAEEYIRKSKGTEALTSVKMMALGAQEFAETERVEVGSIQSSQSSGFPRAAAGPTPPLGACCKGEKQRCAPDPSLWSQPPWSDLTFTVDHPHYYSYQYKPAGDGQSFTALAFGDLDCDGSYSTFSLTGTIGADGATSIGQVSRDNPLE